MKTPPRNSIAAMGFEAKFNADYAAFATAEATPYEQLVDLIDQGKNNGEIGRYFGRLPQAVRKWRPHVECIRAAGL